MIDIKSKLPATGTTIFTVMSRLAQEYNAINLSQGFPDFDVDPDLIDLVNFYMKNRVNQYAPMQGIPLLRKAIANKINKAYNSNYDFESAITITAGATQAIFTAIATIVNKDDEVIIFEPAYDCYAPAVELFQGKTIHLELKTPGFKIDFEELEKSINKKTKAIIINNPNNPAGSVFTKEELINLSDLLKNKNVFILSDEVYEHMVFDNHTHHSVASIPDLANKSFIFFSFGKTFHATGWKVGYCIAPEYLMKEFRKVHQFNVFCVNSPIQHALADYLIEEKNYNQLNEFYQKKRNKFLDLIKSSDFKISPSQGTYFQLLDYSDISNEPDFDFAVRLIKEYGIASVPVSSFYKKENGLKMLRFCFAKKEETLIEASNKIIAIK